jgi:hypothetical protein
VFSAAFEIETPNKTLLISPSYSIKKTNDYEIVNYFTASLKESVIWTSATVFNRSLFDELGCFDINIKSGQDTDMWIRIGLHYPVLFTWKILARYIYDEKSLSKNPLHHNEKLIFLKFTQQEKTIPELKNFLDLNRFSLAIKSKISHQEALFDSYYMAINLKNLSLKKRILLQLPAFLLKRLIVLKSVLAELGWSSSVFK